MANPAKFVREVRQETNKVTWPTRKETMVSTVMVLVLTGISMLFFLIADTLIGEAVQLILGLGS